MTEMTPAEAVFFAAAALPVADRPAYFDRVCAGNDELRRRVERMLAARPEVGDFLEVPPVSPVEGVTAKFGTPDGSDAGPTAELPGEGKRVGTVVAGRYKLIQQIGEGGMGTVWVADQTEPVKRRVAVKLIRVEKGWSKTILSRFEAERQAIALMDHPHIAKLLDAGTTESGSPFFVMELVKGTPLTEFCDAHKLDVPARLNLFMQICSAVQHAHQKGIIHRHPCQIHRGLHLKTEESKFGKGFGETLSKGFPQEQKRPARTQPLKRKQHVHPFRVLHAVILIQRPPLKRGSPNLYLNFLIRRYASGAFLSLVSLT